MMPAVSPISYRSYTHTHQTLHSAHNHKKIKLQSPAMQYYRDKYIPIISNNMESSITTPHPNCPVLNPCTSYSCPTWLAYTYITYSATHIKKEAHTQAANGKQAPLLLLPYNPANYFFECTGIAVFIRSIWPPPLPPLQGASVSRRHGTGMC